MAKSPLELSQRITSPFSGKISRDNKNPRDFFGSYRKVNLSPNDYFKLVASQSNISVNDLIKDRENNANEISVNDIRSKMKSGIKFDTPWVRLTDKGEKGNTLPYFQEGLHRMLAAGKEYGMDTKFPIYLGYENDPWNEIDKMSMDDFIKHYDETRLNRYNKYKADEEAKQKEIDDWYREQASDHFNVLLKEVTPELIKQYKKYEDDLMKEQF